MRKILERCPTCHGPLTITEVQCDACGTLVRSRYAPCPFCGLTEDQQTFLLLFLRSRGNLKEVEKTLGVSYPTVRAKLEELVDALPGLPQPQSAPAAASDPRRAVLERLQAGQITAAQALELLRSFSGAPEEASHGGD
ncbi:MAG: DUF2089 domain-containing protein [Caldilineales bacterium]|nr:DUF2089 domain-containing protein [Caldilineales bacterium]